MITKGKLRLTSKHPYYDLYAGMWLNIVNITNEGYFICEHNKDNCIHTIIVSNNYELYEQYIKNFRTKPNTKSNYKPILQDEFEKLLQDRIELIHKSLVVKGKEYASNGREDRMHNFIAAAKRSGDTPEKALDGMLAKHLISYQDMIDDLDKNIKPTKEFIKEKYGDIINYFILSEMLLLKRLK